MTHREEIIGDCRLILGDCRDILPTLGKVDAVVTDPPYGIGIASNGRVGGGTGGKGSYPKAYTPTSWDGEIAGEAVEMARSAARHAIIFGGNYYPLPPARCWLVWDKETTGGFADCELAWTNLDKTVRRIRHLWNGLARAGNEPRGDHPSQKPVGVMTWCLSHLPDDAKTILDPFMGSGTTGVACANLGRSFVGIEREPSYFDIACRRIEEAYKQPRLFAEPAPKPVQTSLLGDAA
jgi:DNA modification methylase